MFSTKRVVRFIFAVLLVSVAASCCYAEDYFDIYKDWKANPFKAEHKWLGKIITIKSDVKIMDRGSDGLPYIVFAKKMPNARNDHVLYQTWFTDKNNIPKELFDVETDQFITIRGRVNELTNKEGSLLITVEGIGIIN